MGSGEPVARPHRDVVLVEPADFRPEAVGLEPADGFLARVAGTFFAREAGDEVGDFVRVVIVRL